jgi:cell wall-associated NlpC family hydrolase
LAVLASILLTTGSNAGAQDIATLRERADKLATELDALQEKASIANEEYLVTLDALDAVKGDIATTKAAVAEAQARVGKAEDQASEFLITSYMEAGSTQAITAVGTSDLNSTLNQKMLLDTLRGDREQLADDLSAVRSDLADRESELAAKQEKLNQAEADQAAAKDRVEAAVAEQEDLYNAANDELKEAVAAEQARREAEAVARAQAEAERAAAAAAAEAASQAAAAPSTPTGGAVTSGSTSSTSTSRPEVSGGPSDTSTPPVVQPPAPVSPPASGAAGAIAAAKSQLGNPYRYGGSSPSTGFDCSGLTSWAWAQAGRSLPRTSRAQYAATQRVSVSQLQPGDLVFFGSPIHHVGLYIGGGQMIHSPRTGDVVKISSIYSSGSPMGGRLG